MNKHTFVFCCCCLTMQETLWAHGNGWSFEPPPRNPVSDTNESVRVPPQSPSGETNAALQLPGRTVADLLDRRIFISVGSRFDPFNLIENLSRETPDEWLDELQTRKGKSGVANALRLTFREYFVRTLGIGGAFGKILGGTRIGDVRPSPFNLSEGLTSFEVGTREISGYSWGIEAFRESPYAVLEYTYIDWFGTPLWGLQSRLQAQDWQIPRVEFTAGLYAHRALSFEAGVQFRAEVEGRGSRFARGDDQKFAVFCGANIRFSYGNLLLRLSGPDTIRGSVAYTVGW